MSKRYNICLQIVEWKHNVTEYGNTQVVYLQIVGYLRTVLE